MLKLAIVFAAIAVPLQIFVGDLHGLNVGKYQPTKLAAMEAYWQSAGEGRGVPLGLFAVPNEKAERNDYEIAIPRLGSLLLTHSLDGEIQPLKAVPASERPPVKPVFYAFRVMVGLGVAMLALVLASLLAWRRGALFDAGSKLGRAVLNGWLALRRLRCAAGRLVRGRDRPPAVRDLRPAAHRRRGDPDARGRHGVVLIARVRGGLRHGVRRRHLVLAETGAQWPAAAGAGPGH